jgi:hypothetical protein
VSLALVELAAARLPLECALGGHLGLGLGSATARVAGAGVKGEGSGSAGGAVGSWSMPMATAPDSAALAAS